MRLHPHLIEFIAESVIADLVKDGKIRIQNDRMLVGVVENIIEQEMELEAKLDEEVRKILSEHYEEIRRGGVSYDDMFRKIKSMLAREKGIVL